MSKPPWTKPLNWDLHITFFGEELVPFHSYVRPVVDRSRSLSQSSWFPKFRNLSAELQLHILTFCPAPTLYQLMQTSMLRTEAAKLFWADPNTFYLIEAYWLIGGAHPGAHPGYTCYDLSFMAYAQNIEVEYDFALDKFIGPIRDVDEYYDYVELDYGKAGEFWKNFQRRFPCAKKVVINQKWESVSSRQHDDELGICCLKDNVPVACCLKALIEACPEEISVFAYVLVEVDSGCCKRTVRPVPNNWHRVLYQLTEEGKWKNVTTSELERKTVLMPFKKFHGPVGEFEKFRYEEKRNLLALYGLGVLAVEALDRFYFDREDPEPFHCPVSGCDVDFDQAGQWTQHAAEMHNEDLMVDLMAKSRFDILPNALQHVFEERKKGLEQESKAIAVKYNKIYRDWNEEGSEKRREIEHGWMYQLENDELWDTGVKAADSKLWKWFTTMMNPTWNGQIDDEL